jgi:hypothetical protein
MTFAESRGDTVPVQLPNGAVVKVEVTSTGREDVGFDVKQFQPVADAIEGGGTDDCRADPEGEAEEGDGEVWYGTGD